MWFPYRAAPAEAVLRWAATSLEVFGALADDPSSGVTLRPGTVVHRTAEPDLWWAPSVAGHRPATPDELPVGAVAGTRCTLPVVHMGRYLPFLLDSCRGAGVTVVPARSTGSATCPGTSSWWPPGSARARCSVTTAGVPVQGQVVRLADPGLTGWVLDEDNPAGLTYVVPRGDDVVVGGTAVEGATGLEPGSRRGGRGAGARVRPGARAPGGAGAVAVGRAAPRSAHRPARPHAGRRPAGGLLLRARGRRGHPLLGLRHATVVALVLEVAAQPASACSAIRA